MTSILIVDRHSSLRTSLQAAFERDGGACATLDPSVADDAVSSAALDRDGVLVRIDDDALPRGWDVARQARAANPAVAIGYLSTRGTSDWAASGVPDSVVYAPTSDPIEITAAFLALCRPASIQKAMGEPHGERPSGTARARLGPLGNDLIHGSRRNAMGMMATTIANELTQPLTTIGNYLAVARAVVESRGDSALVLESLQAAIEASRTAGHIIRTLQSLTTRPEARLEQVALTDTLRDAADIVTLGRPDARITLDLPHSLIVLGDRILLQQTLLNLLQNAVEAAAGTPVDILVTASDKGQVVEVCVADSGPGVDRMLLPNVFEPFVTTKADSLGIGLSICKAIIEAQGGVITLRNRATCGAIACFTVPGIA